MLSRCTAPDHAHIVKNYNYNYNYNFNCYNYYNRYNYYKIKGWGEGLGPKP